MSNATNHKTQQIPRSGFNPSSNLQRKLINPIRDGLQPSTKMPPRSDVILVDHKHGEITDMNTNEKLTPSVTDVVTAIPTIVIDTREQLPYSFDPQFPDDITVNIEREALKSGDYSITGFTERIAIERKSPADFLGSITQGRERFSNELHRLCDYEYRWVLIECDTSDMYSQSGFEVLRCGKQVSHASVLGTIDWIQCNLNIPVIFGGERPYSQMWVKRTLARLWKLYAENDIFANRNTHGVRN